MHGSPRPRTGTVGGSRRPGNNSLTGGLDADDVPRIGTNRRADAWARSRSHFARGVGCTRGARACRRAGPRSQGARSGGPRPPGNLLGHRLLPDRQRDVRPARPRHSRPHRRGAQEGAGHPARPRGRAPWWSLDPDRLHRLRGARLPPGRTRFLPARTSLGRRPAARPGDVKGDSMIQRLLLTGLVVAPLLLVLPGEGQAQYFGRNKVQYRAFDFKIIETEHFDIYFYEEEREAALDVARMAERAYARLSKILQHEFRDRKAIILYASHTDFQQTNTSPSFIDEGTGAFAEPLKNRVVIPLTGSYADFEHVLTHELVHAFQFDIIYRRGVMSDASPFRAPLPPWVPEGMAGTLSLVRLDAQTAAWVRDASLSGYLRSIAEMNRRDDYLSYRFGQSLWAYVGSKWGDEVIGILLQRAPRVGLERAFQSTLGLTLDELSEEWMAAVRSTYFPQVTDYQRPDQFAERLTHHARLE